MKIVCMIRSLTLGGAERQLTGLAVMLQKAGHDVEVLTYIDGDFYAPLLKEEGVRHIFIPKKFGNKLLEKAILAHFREFRPDVVISFLTGPNVKACHVRRHWPYFRLIVSERNVNTWTGPHDLWRMDTYCDADMVVTNSHAQENYIRQNFPFLEDKLKTIVNFVDTDFFTPEERPANEIPQIVTTARVDSRKNVLSYIHALDLLKQEGLKFHARWYGLKKPDSYYRRCKRLIRRLHLSDTFEILPATRDILPIYRSSDIFCLPSFYEGTPNSLCEALSCGLPAVATHVSDNEIYVREGINGYTCSTSAEEIADALGLCLKLAEDPDAGTASRKTALTLLTKDVFLRSWQAVL